MPTIPTCPNAKPLCRPGAGFSSTPLDRQWTSHENATLRNDLNETNVNLFDDCNATTVSELITTPRLLGICSDRKSKVRFALWSPSHTRVWEEDLKLSSLSPKSQTRPVVAVEWIGQSEVPVRRWIDLEKHIQWTSELVLPILFSGTFGFARHVLVHPTNGTNALWVLDLIKGNVSVVMQGVDCDGALVQNDISQKRTLVSCIAKTGLSHIFRPNERIRHYVWTEVIDFARSNTLARF